MTTVRFAQALVTVPEHSWPSFSQKGGEQEEIKDARKSKTRLLMLL